MELLVIMKTIFARSHMWFKHGEKLEHIVAKYYYAHEAKSSGHWLMIIKVN